MRVFLHPPSTVLPLVLIALGSLLPAQGTPVRYIGGATLGAATGIQAQAWCTPPLALCPPPIFAPPAIPNAGGTAYDPGTQTVWDTEGTRIMGFSTATFMAPCVVKCPAMPLTAIGVPAGLFVTGLAFDELNRNLLGVDNAVPPNIYVWGLTATGCPALRFRCTLPAGVFPAGWVTSGLAHSERYGMTFVLADNFPALPAPILAGVVVAAAGCQVRCAFRPFPCTAIAMRHLRGAAFDDCTSQFTFTDGINLLRNDFIPTPNCTMTNPQCCTTTVAAGIYYGFDIEASHPVRRGSSCTAPSCPNCANMLLTSRSDPSLANGIFSLDLMNAPGGGIAFGLLGPGPCTPGLPFGCGFYYPILPPAPIVLGSVGIAGAGCGGTASMTIPIPLDPSLCGANLCAQMLIFCLGAPLGIGLTNGLDLTISDS